MTLKLSAERPFSRGGNRLCFVHPDHPNRCIKVRRPEFTLEDYRRKKGFPKSLLPLSFFDDNAEEFRVLRDFQQNYADSIFDHVSRGYGMIETDLGLGICSELILDHTGDISMSLMLYLWNFGYTDECKAAVKVLQEHWMQHLIPSRSILLHNIVVERCLEGGVESINRLVVIDGLGATGIAALPFLPQFARRYLVGRKVKNL
ncbi:MAG: PhoP regulatory network YrbL family protein, partial [Gammaproteobacteria bacterium]|nr:PhoP regulatory network YrbL family protein [Gammaproteobacteria bacterium]MBU1831635.1 PhoP regulatory network YrbL family protein [Gammaproteobacteria bacterium]